MKTIAFILSAFLFAVTPGHAFEGGVAASNAATATTATNLWGGLIGSLPYQDGVGSTAMLPAGTANYVLQCNGLAAPSWENSLTVDITGALTGNADTATTATNIAVGAANQIVYQNGAGSTAFVAAPGANVVLIGNSGAPSWTNTPTLTATNVTGLPAASVDAGSLGAGVIASSIAVDAVYANAILADAVTNVKIADVAPGKVSAGAFDSDVYVTGDQDHIDSLTASSITATGTPGFDGDGTNITGTTIVVSSEAISGQTIPTDYIGIATVTFVSARGGRPLYCRGHFTVDAAGGATTVTLKMTRNSVDVDGERIKKVANNSTGWAEYDFHTTSTAGGIDTCLLMKSDANTPTALHPHITCWEY